MKRTLLTLMLPVVVQAAGPSALLDRAARAAEQEISALSAVVCTETVLETKLNPKDKTEERRRRSFDYLLMLDTDDGDLAVTESRVEQNPSKKADARPLLATQGFAAMMMILHPYYQNSFEFSDLGSIQEGGRPWRRLGFQFVPGRRSPSVLRAGAREYPLAWKGEVIVDEGSGHVSLIHVSLGSQLEEIGLESLDATVRYGPPGKELNEWLPLEAVIDLKTHHQHWHNVHTFANYKRFEVTTTEKREAGKLP